MLNKEEIDKAIGAHGMWKTRLKQAIETGKSEVSVETIRQDNQCNFGKWLYGSTLSAADKSSAQYKTVRELHAELGLTMVMVTHDLDTLFSLATRVAVLADKRVIVTDTPQKVVQFEHPFIRQFFQGERGLRAMAPPAIAKDR